MKKLFVIVSILAFSTVVFSQAGDRMEKDDMTMEKKMQEKYHDKYVVMKKGKIWLMEDGEAKAVEEEMKLGDTKISPDGMVTMKDGTSTKLNEGDKVTASGMLKRMDKKMEKQIEQKEEERPDY